MSSTATAAFSESKHQSSARRYRGAYGNEITLCETRHNNNNNSGSSSSISNGDHNNGAIEYVLRDESRRGLSVADLGLLCFALVLWSFTRSTVSIGLGLLALGLSVKSAFFADRTNTLLLVKSVGVHINRKTIFGALEEYLPWNSISDIFINEVICEQKVLYYLTFIVKEFTGNGEERIRLIPLFQDLKPE